MNKTTTAGIPGIAGAIAEIEKRNGVVKPTPGPWRPFLRYVLSDGRFLATAHAIGDTANGKRFAAGQEPSQDMNEAEANARLIAKAPELFDQVKDYVENADCGNGGEHTEEYGDKAENCWHCKARRLVESIEGRAQ